MLLKIVTLTLEPVDPIQFSLPGLRSLLAGKLGEYTEINKSNANGFIHRYPVIQCKQVKNRLMVIGICQGAAVLEELSHDTNEIVAGKNSCTILERDAGTRQEAFGISGTMHTYEFLTPYLALNQQNAKKFYELKGKPERDAFMHKILAGSLATLAKSLDYKPPVPITCQEKIKFRIDWIERESVIVFLGKFQTNCRIPDYFGIGQSVSQGFGTVKSIPDIPARGDEAGPA
ncbi:MAG: CRISPR-associated endonuclease Cas6 [Methanoregula sp.]|nr:CRISPR-associated endonuclease Cas6 [Methanoregula sp.]